MTEKISGKSVKWPKPDFEKKNLDMQYNVLAKVDLYFVWKCVH